MAGDAVEYLPADARCRPLAFVLTAGQAGDAPAFTEVMARLRVPRRRGRPRTRPDLVLADKAYSSRAIHEHLRRRGIRTVIPERADQQANRGVPVPKLMGSRNPPGHQAAMAGRNRVGAGVVRPETGVVRPERGLRSER
ncbi:hypothetical protein GCM10009575_079310 [Streptomyces rhizosphaericus]|uniref:Transposase IS4-like domain-containing protein n=1 Tax=Streptomyces rhizosphaericus TaxID=114699 RepID=A0ABP4BRE7_9ACTN